MIHQLKYHKRWGLGEELARRMLQQERVKAVLHEADVLVPVPLHWWRQFTRSYNQAEVIARWLGKRCGKPVACAVRRHRATPTQTLLHSHAQREENLRDAFTLIGPAAVTGKHVVLVDDVWTTGATLQAMARVIKPAKPASLCALVVGAADPKGYERVEKTKGEEALSAES